VDDCKTSYRSPDHRWWHGYGVSFYFGLGFIPIKQNQMKKQLPIMTSATVNSVPEFRIYLDGVIIRRFASETEAKICLAKLIDTILKQ
jgi:hypothetical protein